MSCDRVRRELATFGILLLQDKKLPSVATLIAGEPMSKSWWAHPLAHEMFRCLESIESEAVVTRLIGGKVTYIHTRLWPALAASGVAIEDEVHTESGRHVKRIEQASEWSKRLSVKPLQSAASGRKELERAAEAIGAPLSSLPWRK